VSGANVAHQKLADIASARGADAFGESLRALQRLSEAEFRRRIAALADGIYQRTTWVEQDDQLFELPCTLTVAGDRMSFDLTGAAAQAPYFFNSQPYIIKSEFMMQAGWILGADLPYTEGLLAPVNIESRPGTIVHAQPPAPVASGHMHVGMAAAETMVSCLRMAMWATPGYESGPAIGEAGFSALALQTWSGIGLDGVPDTFMMMDGAWAGGAAADDRDGQALTNGPVGPGQPAQYPDIEILESWYPVLIDERAIRRGLNGAGAHRSGGGTLLRFRPHGTDRLVGQMIAMRGLVPLLGLGRAPRGA
jgi:N-methylhydantoinase B